MGMSISERDGESETGGATWDTRWPASATHEPGRDPADWRGISLRRNTAFFRHSRDDASGRGRRFRRRLDHRSLHLSTPARNDFNMPANQDERGLWECFTTIAALASATERIQIGSLVACTGFRNPGLVGKMSETIDDISGGRFILGLGAGWHKPEYDMFGYPFDHRVSRFEDAMAIVAPFLHAGRADYQGPFFQATNAVNRPRGPRPGGAPILVGRSGERMLRITARYADAWNTVWHKEPAAVAPLMDAVDTACREVGRDPGTLVRTAGGNIAMPGYLGARPNPIEGEDEVIAQTVLGFRDQGMQHFIAGLDPCTPRSIEQFGRVIEMIDAAG